MTISGWTLVLLLVSAQRTNQNPGPVSVRQSESSCGSYTRLSISTEIIHQHRDTSLIPWQYTNNQEYYFYIFSVIMQFVLILWWGQNHHANPVKTQGCTLHKQNGNHVFWLLNLFIIVVFYNLLILLDCESEAVLRSNAHGPWWVIITNRGSNWFHSL